MQREKNICVFCHFQFSGAYVYVWNEPSSICNLLSERRAAVSMKGMQITDFREQLCSQMLQFDDSTAATASFTASSSRHCLGTTTQKQSGKRPDRHLRKYCKGCYEALKELQYVEGKLHERKPSELSRNAKHVMLTTALHIFPDTTRSYLMDP